jgi:hypothetical protein
MAGRRASEEVGLPACPGPRSRCPEGRRSLGPARPAHGAPKSAVPCPGGGVPSRRDRAAVLRRVPLDAVAGPGACRGRAPGAPKGSACRAAVERFPVPRGAPFSGPCESGSRCPEGRRSALPVKLRSRLPEGCRPLGSGPCPGPRGRGSDRPVTWRRASEEVGFPVAVEVGGPVLRRAPGSLPRRGRARRLPEGCRPPCPGWSRAPVAPKSSVCRAPVKPGSRLPEGCRPPCFGGTRLAAPRGGRPSCPWPGPCPLQAGDGCARKRSRCDDAPIRRSGPPRHRAQGAPGCRSARRHPVKPPDVAGAEAPTPR